MLLRNQDCRNSVRPVEEYRESIGSECVDQGNWTDQCNGNDGFIRLIDPGFYS